MSAKKMLEEKQQAFIEHYLTCWNGAEAARRAGYSKRSARQIAHELLTKPDIKDAISTRLKDLAMSADEVIARLSDHAAGSFVDFVKIVKGKPKISLPPEKMHLIKKLVMRPGEFGTTFEIELYDAQAALVQLGRHHQIFTDKTDITSAGGQLSFNILPAPSVSDSPSGSSDGS